MWIWYISKSEGGNLDAIGSRARAAGMSTVFVKSADAGNVWGQFSPQLLADVRVRGLRVCAWQFVYGADPLAEARAAIASIAARADCFVIDAETAYDGRYAAAQRYMAALRAAVGPSYPIGFTSFPYVDYHPRLPYSVFLGPAARKANMPQVYRRAIGGSVDAVSAKTVAQNRIHGAPIAPIDQSATRRRTPTCAAAAPSGAATERADCRGGAGRRRAPPRGTCCPRPRPARPSCPIPAGRP